MKVFKISDLWGIIGAALFLVLIYLVLNNYAASQGLLGTTLTSSNTLIKTLQGR